MKLCLVASSGGHLLELLSLREAWAEQERFWVTFPKNDALILLKDERVFWAYFPTNRNLMNLLRNLALAWQLLRREHPDVIVSTGAGVGVPFLWIGKFLGIRTIFVESLARIHGLSLTGWLVYPVTDRFFVQWPDLIRNYPKAIYGGRVL